MNGGAFSGTLVAEQFRGEEMVMSVTLPDDALERAAHEREVEAVLEGLADSHAGRVTPLAEWDAKFRARHSIPANLEPLSEEELNSLP